MSLHRMIRAVRNAAPRSEPIQPFERRVISMIILAVVAGAWLSIWAVRHLEAQSEDGPLGTRDIRVSLPLEDAALPIRG